MTPFPGPPATFPGHIGWFPGPFFMEILIFLHRLVHTFSGSVESIFVSSYTFPGPPNRFPGPPDTFPGYIGPFPGLLLMEILIYYPRLVQWSGGPGNVSQCPGVITGI